MYGGFDFLAHSLLDKTVSSLNNVLSTTHAFILKILI